MVICFAFVVYNADAWFRIAGDTKIKYLLGILTKKKALHLTQKSTEITKKIEPKRRQQRRQNYTCYSCFTYIYM